MMIKHMSVNKDYNFIKKAIDFASNKHEGQLDDDGKDYFDVHCMKVFGVLNVINSRDVNLLCAAVLHDTLEDTQTTYEELVNEFNKDVADLVLEVTQSGDKEHKGFYFPNLKTKRGIMLKFADRLSNLSRMESWDIAKQEHYLNKSKFWKARKDEPTNRQLINYLKSIYFRLEDNGSKVSSEEYNLIEDLIVRLGGNLYSMYEPV